MIRMRLLPLLLSPVLVLAGCGGSDEPEDAGTGPCSYVETGEPAKEVDLPKSTPDPEAPTELTISTSAGDIPVTLEPETAPCAVNSFVSLAEQDYFNGTDCHRLTTAGAYVLQCGDPTGTGTGDPGYSFADELVENDQRLQPCIVQDKTYCTYNAGTIAMANAGADTNGSQFFLVYENSTFEPNYTVLGHTDAAGLKVLKEIAAGGVDDAQTQYPGDGPPKTPVTITSVK